MSGRRNDIVSVRLEGGLGDHILGMRVLRSIRARYPHHAIVIYSDAAGGRGQQQIAAMSPYVSRVVPIYHRAPPANREAMGALENLRPDDLALMMSANVFIDACGQQFFSGAVVRLDVPIFEILGHRPELIVPSEGVREADQLLGEYPQANFIGLNLSKYGPTMLERHRPLLFRILEHLLQQPSVFILNMFMSTYSFAHWPDADRAKRQQTSEAEAAFLTALGQFSDRILPCVNYPIATIAALLKRCCYFIGVDNGIKHLAWALGIPHTLLHPARPDAVYALRWMPDLNRILLLDCKESDLLRHLDAATTAVRQGGDGVSCRSGHLSTEVPS